MRQVLVFDLDDTLYKEIDFLKSAYWQIANRPGVEGDAKNVFCEMMSAYYRHDNVFQCFISNFCPHETVAHLLDIYRNHQPHISLSSDTAETLERLSSVATLAIITDGRSVTQRNKIAALRLNRFFRDADILISEEIGFEKPSEVPFRLLMDRYPDCEFCYIGDNTAKDFIAPNMLGWNTICLRDNGENIHSQNFDVKVPFLPNSIIGFLSELSFMFTHF